MIMGPYPQAALCSVTCLPFLMTQILTYKMIHAMAGSLAPQELFQFLGHVGKIQMSIWNLYLSAQMSSVEQ